MSAGWSRIEHMNEGSVHSGLESTGETAVDAAFELLARGIAAVNALDLTALVRLDSPSTGLHAAGRNLELLRRQLGVFDAHYVTAVEVHCSEHLGERFHLFRLFGFGPAPRGYVLRGALEKVCQLAPVVYRASR